MTFSLPTIGITVVTAIIDSINPCAIGVLILLLSLVMANRAQRKRLLMITFVYIASVFLTYLAAGFGLIAFLTNIPLLVTEIISIFVALLVIVGGLVEIKDFFWYGQGFSLAISAEHAKTIHKMMKNISIPGVALLGAFVAGVELPCTGGPYLAITLLLAQNFNFYAVMLLVLYNLIFVLPLMIIALLVFCGSRLSVIKKWKHGARRYMRLIAGITMILLGWLLILMANGTINLG